MRAPVVYESVETQITGVGVVEAGTGLRLGKLAEGVLRGCGLRLPVGGTSDTYTLRIYREEDKTTEIFSADYTLAAGENVIAPADPIRVAFKAGLYATVTSAAAAAQTLQVAPEVDAATVRSL